MCIRIHGDVHHNWKCCNSSLQIFYSSCTDFWAGLSKGLRCHSQDYKGRNNAECVPLPAKTEVTPALLEGFELTSQLIALSIASDHSISPGEAVLLYKELNINWNQSHTPHPTCTPYTRLFSWPCCPFSWKLSGSGKDPVGESGRSHTYIKYCPVWKLSSMLGCKRTPSSVGLEMAGESKVWTAAMKILQKGPWRPHPILLPIRNGGMYLQ